MTASKGRLPQLDGGMFLTDGGIETDLIFNDRIELPYFAAFDLLKTKEGTASLRGYFVRVRSKSPRPTPSASSSRAPPGAPAPIGDGSSAIARRIWLRPTPRPLA